MITNASSTPTPKMIKRPFKCRSPQSLLSELSVLLAALHTSIKNIVPGIRCTSAQRPSCKASIGSGAVWDTNKAYPWERDTTAAAISRTI